MAKLTNAVNGALFALTHHVNHRAELSSHDNTMIRSVVYTMEAEASNHKEHIEDLVRISGLLSSARSVMNAIVYLKSLKNILTFTQDKEAPTATDNLTNKDRSVRDGLHNIREAKRNITALRKYAYRPSKLDIYLDLLSEVEAEIENV